MPRPRAPPHRADPRLRHHTAQTGAQGCGTHFNDVRTSTTCAPMHVAGPPEVAALVSDVQATTVVAVAIGIG